MSERLSTFLRSLYLFILFTSVFLLAISSFFLWNSITKETKTELSYANNIVSSSMQSLLYKNESIFKITGQRLLELGILKNTQQAINLIDDLLINNPELVGIGIADPQGNIMFSTSNLKTKNLPNLLKKKETAESFKMALNSDALVMGRTYFLKELNDWIIPIRYRIVNQQDEVVAVFATGLMLNSEHSLLQRQNQKDDLRISIINSEYYFLFASFLNSDSQKKLYTQPINQDYLSYFSQSLQEQTGFVLNDFIAGVEEIVTLIYQGPTGAELIAAFSYDTKYSYFTFTTKKISSLYPRLYIPVAWLSILLLGFNVILFCLFKYLSKLQRQSKQDLLFQAQHDSLTGLPNLRYLTTHFNQWKKTNGESFSVIFLDLDDFKNSNDLHGHSTGDKILCEVAKRITAFFKNSLCIRQGGDEFIIVSQYLLDDSTVNLCEEFLISLKHPIEIDDLDFSIRASMGIAQAPFDGIDLEQLLSKADIAMYEAKRNKIGVNVFSHELDVKHARIATICKELNTALNNDEMSLVYQPQIDKLSNKIVGVETLLRWNNKTLGPVSPSEFIPLAESTGVILEIGKFVFKKAFEEFHEVCNRFLSESNEYSEKDTFRLSINVSIMQLSDVRFLDDLFSLTQEYDCKNAKLMLEITETLIIDKIDDVSLILKKIQAAGIEISLDDFGTGYSSLSHLSKLPINELKIDKSFVHGIPNVSQDMVLIKSIINLADSLGVDVLAEGVETLEQIEFLNKHGCHSFQGFYYSKPLNKNVLLKYLLNQP